jgi:diguanylate cyclase (GGDEF)-like protein
MSSIIPKSDSIDWTGSLKKQRVRTRSRAGDSGQQARSRFASAPAQIWKSRLSWRITLVVFLTILITQTSILYMSFKREQESILSELSNQGISAIAPLIDEQISMMRTPIDPDEARRLLSTTKVLGLRIYSSTGDTALLASYGQPTALSIVNRRIPNGGALFNEGNAYEQLFRPGDLKRPYYIIARLDSSHLRNKVFEYVQYTILITLLMSAFVTSALMVALGHWLLEPILFLRDNLLKASEDPENPGILESPFDPGDEIGKAIEIATELIQQNADNIKRIKSAAENQIHRLAYYDTLTGLPNRTLFLQTLNEKAREMVAEGTSGRFAVIALDLDHFKDINDTMGHNIGDAILRAVGKRLRASMPKSAEVARSGEDEFAITMPLLNDNTNAKDIAERVIGVIRTEPFKVFNENFQIRASIGVATFPDDGSDPDQVLKNADIALNRAKEEGRDTIKEYSEDFDRAVQQRFQMLRDLRDAMEHEQLLMHFQPQLDLKTGNIIGAEALLRWWKPDNSKEGGHFISPADFIPIAEQSGLIVPIGEWVMKTACRNAREWRDKGIDIRIAVNVSGVQFYQSDIIGFVSRVLQETGLEPHKLELEVTESIFMDDINHTIATLQQLHKLGVELAIDDFGTGYSSLSYLRQFPIDRLKIDQSFIRNALNNPDDASIARTIVRLGHSLNLKVIAEGVETSEHEKFLLEEGCDEVQGFRYSRPVPADSLLEFATSYNGKLESFD